MIQYQRKEGGGIYAPRRDVLNWFKPVVRLILEQMGERHPTRIPELHKLATALSGMINEIVTGAEAETIEQITRSFEEHTSEVDPSLVAEFHRTMSLGVIWRYILAERVQDDDRPLDLSEMKKDIGALMLLSSLPPGLAAEVRAHLQAYNHVTTEFVNQEPPAVPEESND